MEPLTELPESLKSILSTTEIKISKTYHSKRNERRFIVTRIILRLLLTACSREKMPSQWRIAQSSFGRPFITNQARFPYYFNITHSAQYSSILISKNPVSGVDIELIDYTKKIDELAHTALSQLELRDYKSLSNKEKVAYFYWIWTLKEAYLKSLGTGISNEINSLSFYLDMHRNINLKIDPDKCRNMVNWDFFSYCLDRNLCISIAAKKNKKEIPIPTIKTITSIERNLKIKWENIDESRFVKYCQS